MQYTTSTLLSKTYRPGLDVHRPRNYVYMWLCFGLTGRDPKVGGGGRWRGYMYTLLVWADRWTYTNKTCTHTKTMSSQPPILLFFFFKRDAPNRIKVCPEQCTMTDSLSMN